MAGGGIAFRSVGAAVTRERSARQSRPWGPMSLVALLALWVGLTVLQTRLFERIQGGRLLETVIVFGLVNLNILVLLLLLFVTLRNLAKLAFERRRGLPGARLRAKLVLAFLAMAAVPTALLFLASAGFLARSIDTWFSGRVEGALRQSMEVARAYYRVEEDRVAHAAAAAARQVVEEGLLGQREALAARLEQAVRVHRLGAMAVVAPDGSVLAWAGSGDLSNRGAEVATALAVREALQGRATSALAPGGEEDYVRAAVPLLDPGSGEAVAALAAEGPMRRQTMDSLQEITAGFEEYRQLQVLKSPIKASYILPLLMVALLITFAATWFGFHLARGITDPIRELADATERVAGGDLDFQVAAAPGDEIGVLVESFNRMTRDLRASKAGEEAAQLTLRRANEELDRRRRYMEIVLGRIATGVVSADRDGCITTMNAAAREMLGLGEESAAERPYREVLPETVGEVVAGLLRDLGRSAQDTIQSQVTVEIGGAKRTVMVHLTRLRDEGGEGLGTVAVFDDLTEMVRAQRAEAWQEVARRIAHEIKNPLTPVQLSAQRIRRRYAELLAGPEGEVLDDTTRTIIAQVDGLKRLVDEFSRFAKMPESRPAPEDLNQLVERMATLYRRAQPAVRFETTLAPDLPIVAVDAQQMERALVNLLDNAVAALVSAPAARVDLSTEYDAPKRVVRLVVADNGPGIPAGAMERLFEPYFSTKKSGTGLGLAIVKSIVADHRGYVKAGANDPVGARFELEIPLSGEAA